MEPKREHQALVHEGAPKYNSLVVRRLAVSYVRQCGVARYRGGSPWKSDR